MNLREKLEIARQLARLKVDIIEAGFPVISDGDFEAVESIAREISGPVIAGLARCVPKDIEAAGRALLPAGERARIHVFLATSKIHREHKVRQAKSYLSDVEFSPEDASRTEPEFLAEVVQASIEAGATTVNIPDTVGYAMPSQYADLISYLQAHVRDIHKAVISVHCHDDLGLAVANSLAAVQAGARQVEGTFNGIGERGGHGDQDPSGCFRWSNHGYRNSRNFEDLASDKPTERIAGSAEQGNCGGECLCARFRHSPGWYSQDA